MPHSKHWVGVGILLLAAVGFGRLGIWQLDRAEQNRAVAAAFLAGSDAPALTLPVAAPDDNRYRRIRLQGRYEPATQVLLDNMTLAGTAGYEVLTPFRASSGELVLVNRGWVPAGPDRRALPDVALTHGASVVSGRIDRFPRAAIELGEATPFKLKGLVRLSFPDRDELAAAIGEPIEPFQVLLDAAAGDGFERVWQPDFDRADSNIAYAVQWFALSGLAMLLAVGVTIRARRGRLGS